MTGPETVAAFRTDGDDQGVREPRGAAAEQRGRSCARCTWQRPRGDRRRRPGGARPRRTRSTRLTAGTTGRSPAGSPLEALFGEFMGRETGVNGGRGGAGFFADPDHGFLGESGIVGAGAPIGAGAALAARYDGSGRVALTAFGDGALNQGAVHEAMSFAAILPPAGGLRLREQRLCRVHADRVDVPGRAARAIGRRSTDSPASRSTAAICAPSRETVAEAAARARAGDGPTLVVATARRLAGHHTHDAEQYRPEGEKARMGRRVGSRSPGCARPSLTRDSPDEDALAQIEARRAGRGAHGRGRGGDAARLRPGDGWSSMSTAETTYRAALNAALHRAMRLAPGDAGVRRGRRGARRRVRRHPRAGRRVRRPRVRHADLRERDARRRARRRRWSAAARSSRSCGRTSCSSGIDQLVNQARRTSAG